MSNQYDTEALDTTPDNSTLVSEQSEAVEVSHTDDETSEDELYFWSEPGVCG